MSKSVFALNEPPPKLPTAYEQSRRRRWGAIKRMLGCVLICIGFFGVLRTSTGGGRVLFWDIPTTRSSQDDLLTTHNELRWWLHMLSGAIALCGVYLLTTGQRERWPIFYSLDSLRDELGPERRIVLFLRSFEFDGARAFEEHAVIPGQELNLFRQTDEQSAARCLFAYGTVVAVGDPGEPLPEIGAYRLYVEHDWESVVSALMQEAVLIVVRVGNTPGVLWELDQIISLGQLSRTIILLSENAQVTNAVVDRLHRVGHYSVEPYQGKKSATPPILIAHDGVGSWIETSRGEGLPAAIARAATVLGVPVSGRSSQPREWRRFEVILHKAFTFSAAVTGLLFVLVILAIFGAFGFGELTGTLMVPIMKGFVVGGIISIILGLAGGLDPDV